MQLLKNTTIVACLICFLMTVSRRVKYKSTNDWEDPYIYISPLIWAFAGVLIVVEGFVYAYCDGLTYRESYAMVPLNFKSIWQGLDSPGWVSLEWFFRLFSENMQLLYIFLALFFTIANIWFIKKYSCDLPLSLLLYFLFDFLCCCNGIRQMFAATILMLAFPWIIEKKYIRYIILIVALSSIHTSILVVIPLLFIFGGKRWNIGVIIFIAFCIFSKFAPGLLNLLLDTFFSDSYSDYSYTATANVLHVIVSAVPVILGLLYHYYNRNTNPQNRAMDIIINMQAISFGFMILATSMAQYSRIGWYMRNASAIAIPFLIRGVFDSRSQRIVRFLAVVLYLTEFIIIYIIRTPISMYDTFYLDFSIFNG